MNLEDIQKSYGVIVSLEDCVKSPTKSKDTI